MEEKIITIRLYHYMPSKFAEQFLREDKIKLCDLSVSNDLCEFAPTIQTEDGVVRDLLFCAKGDEILSSFKRRCTMAVLSCSTRITSSAVWGHYADNSKGVCLVFDFPVSDLHEQYGVVMGRLADNENIQFHKIKYTDDKLVITVNECRKSGEKPPAKLNSAISYKSVDWLYEKECRLVFFVERDGSNLIVRDGMYFALGLRKYLSGMVMGARCNLSDMYMRAVVNEINEEDSLEELSDKLYQPFGVSRAEMDHTKLRICVHGYEDYDFDSILPS